MLIYWERERLFRFFGIFQASLIDSVPISLSEMRKSSLEGTRQFFFGGGAPTKSLESRELSESKQLQFKFIFSVLVLILLIFMILPCNTCLIDYYKICFYWKLYVAFLHPNNVIFHMKTLKMSSCNILHPNKAISIKIDRNTDFAVKHKNIFYIYKW